MSSQWYDKYIARIIPRYAFLSLFGCLGVNMLVYSGTQFFMRNAQYYNIESALDKEIPFVPEWVYIYLGCYIFWCVNYILIAREGCEHWFRFAMSDMMSRLVCGVFFVCWPTTNTRPDIVGNGLADQLMKIVFTVDRPANLFPSIHCLVSWFCYIGIRKSLKVSKWYKAFSLIFAVLVCVSTQLTKQHCLIDIVGGIGVAEICYWIGNRTNLYLYVQKAFHFLDMKIFGDDAL